MRREHFFRKKLCQWRLRVCLSSLDPPDHGMVFSIYELTAFKHEKQSVLHYFWSFSAVNTKLFCVYLYTSYPLSSSSWRFHMFCYANCLKDTVKARTTSLWDHCGWLEVQWIRVAKQNVSTHDRDVLQTKVCLGNIQICIYKHVQTCTCSSSHTSSKFIRWIRFEKSLKSYSHFLTVNCIKVYHNIFLFQLALLN